MDSLYDLFGLAAAIAVGGVAFGVLKMKTTTTADLLEELDDDVRDSIEKLSQDLNAHRVESADRFARIETKLDLLIEDRLKSVCVGR